jgi:hypothetical protein
VSFGRFESARDTHRDFSFGLKIEMCEQGGGSTFTTAALSQRASGLRNQR